MVSPLSDPAYIAADGQLTPSAPISARGSSVKAWIRRFGVAGFLFFFIKGLAWLAVPALLARQVMD